jgi:ATP-binding cassette subfamily F protein 3
LSEIALSKVAVEFGGTPIVEDVTFTVSRGDRWGIVGRNGTGKTTLLNIAAGRLAPTRGSVARAPGLRFTLLDQHREFPGSTTVWEAAASPFEALAALERSLEQQATAMGEQGARVSAEALAKYDHDLERFARDGGYTFAPRVDAVLHGLGFDPEQARAQPLSQLSGGELGRIALAQQLVAPADVLLLDEPTNHLDLETTRWLEEYLSGIDATVMVISHDRAFLQAVVDHVLHIEAGTTVVYAAGYDAFVHQRLERRRAQERAFQNQQQIIASEEDYIRRNIAGGNSAQAKGRRKKLARVERLSAPPGEAGSMALRLEAAARGGDQVLVASNVCIAVQDRTLIDGFSGRIARGEVVGLVGPNGAGKSTLLQAVAGLRAVDAGQLRMGESTAMAYYRQDMAQVPTGRTLFSIVHDLRPHWDRGQVQNHLGRFGFSGDAVQRMADNLSGGERARVALALLMLARPNFLLLDEPTNHLDVESIEALEDAIEDFDGTVLLVSHDRALLRTLATRVWSLENTAIVDFDGDFAEWEEFRRDRKAEVARAARADADLRREREKRGSSRSDASEKEARAQKRALRDAAAKAEAHVARCEARVAELKRTLEDPELYRTADGTRRAATLKTQMQAADAEMAAALETWAAATDALEMTG